MICPRPDGTWLPTLDLPNGAVSVVGPDGAAWTITPLSEGGYIASSPTFADNLVVTALVDYGAGGAAVPIAAPPGCGRTPTNTAPAPVVPATASPGTVATTLAGEPSAATVAVEEAGRDRSGLGGIIFILALLVAALFAMIFRSTWRDSRRPIGGTDLTPPADPHDDIPPGWAPLDTPPRPPLADVSVPRWAPSTPSTYPPANRTPTITTPAEPPTTLDADDPATETYARDVSEWLHRR